MVHLGRNLKRANDSLAKESTLTIDDDSWYDNIYYIVGINRHIIMLLNE